MLLLTGVAGDSVIRFKVFVGCCWLSCARCILRPLNLIALLCFFLGLRTILKVSLAESRHLLGILPLSLCRAWYLLGFGVRLYLACFVNCARSRRLRMARSSTGGVERFDAVGQLLFSAVNVNGGVDEVLSS